MNLSGLNRMQKKAVETTEGPLLIIAGAGSGKTKVLTSRIAYLIDDCKVAPYNILAITFTNKAAKEMKERVDLAVGENAGKVWVSTFHSTCVRILRRYIDRIGYDNNFTIYDTEDQKSVIKEICKRFNIDTKMLKERSIMSAISKAKDELQAPADYELSVGGDYNGRRIAQIYREYQKQLRLNNALDFDDIIFKTVELFEKDDEVLNYYQEKFQYIMVDEYQDTNTSQFKLISLLADKYRNLCVVGDDDQSIYKFRGANITNILSFETTFEGAKVIKLEQNYRSTQTILNVANAVIKNNRGRKDKALWTENGEGDLVNFAQYDSGFTEAEGVVSMIAEKVRDGWDYNDIAILYRTNAQSRALEEKLLMRNIPYRIYGGVSFYQRKEIKDLLAYLKTIDNANDGQAVKRIINIPKRGIGDTTINNIQEYADNNEITFWDALTEIDSIDSIKRGAGKVKPFVDLIEKFRERLDDISLHELIEEILEETRYIDSLLEKEEREEVDARKDNINELISKIVSYEQTCKEEEAPPTLSGFLEEVALIADIDNLDESEKQVMLMTLHSAKGLEFPIVFMTGMEDGLFPSYMTITSDDPTEIEEERRLCYVGITRAKKELYLSAAKMRMIRGETQSCKVSRFIKEIPEEYLNIENNCTGYSNNKNISYGGDEDYSSGNKTNFRAVGKSILSAYGSGKTKEYESKRVPIGKSYSSSYGGNAYKSSYSSSASAYTTKPSQSNSGFKTNNTKVGFGKEFPMDLFDLKKGNKKDSAFKRSTNVSAFKTSKEGPSTGLGGIESLGYREGDTVIHAKFGEGIVKKIEESPRDYMVTVDFEEFGIKRMLSQFANLKKK